MLPAPPACVIIRTIIIYKHQLSNLMPNVADLQPGDSACIDKIDAEESLLQRLAALGFRQGKQLEVVRKASFNGPLHVRIGTTDVILRLAEARRIQIQQ
jgi:ferrous iron transport protein A